MEQVKTKQKIPYLKFLEVNEFYCFYKQIGSFLKRLLKFAQ